MGLILSLTYMNNGKKARREERKRQTKEEKKAKAQEFRQRFQSEKKSHQAVHFNDRKDKHPVWKFCLVDWDAPWKGWKELNADGWQKFINKLGQFESCTWGQIEDGDPNNSSHLVATTNCPNPEVLKRLQDIKQDDTDYLFSLRLSSRERIYGILDGPVLKILWYDPEHAIWPSPKKNT